MKMLCLFVSIKLLDAKLKTLPTYWYESLGWSGPEAEWWAISVVFIWRWSKVHMLLTAVETWSCVLPCMTWFVIPRLCATTLQGGEYWSVCIPFLSPGSLFFYCSFSVSSCRCYKQINKGESFAQNLLRILNLPDTLGQSTININSW